MTEIKVPPQTPAEIAAALRLIAAQLDAMSDSDAAGTRLAVQLTVQPRTPADVDRYAIALYGVPAQPQAMGSGSWQHTTFPHESHASGIGVGVFCGVENPELAAARREADELRAVIERIRAEGEARVAAAILTPDAVTTPDAATAEAAR